MRNRSLLIPMIVLTVAFLAGCGSNQKSAPALPGPVLANVDGDKLTVPELDSLSPEGFEISHQNLPQILDKWVSNTLMYQEALRRGIEKEPQVQAHLKRLERDYLVNELLDRLTTNVKIGQDAPMQYFRQHKDEFGYEVKIARIVMTDSVMAAQTLNELKAGADFTEMAKERSQDMALEPGQESRYFARNIGDPRMGGDPAIAEAIFALAPGQLSDVVPSQEGYQIIKLADKKKVKADVSFAEVRDEIEAILSYRRSQAVVDSVLTALRDKAKIELMPDVYFESAGK
ncbi:peptidyl-prolyl cis-trans isomerase [candidate division WOR-3 bacterium]|nr:peptidyl-prolyl cis-trans isomerase [candidate division WOR-3 bacterium]